MRKGSIVLVSLMVGTIVFLTSCSHENEAQETEKIEKKVDFPMAKNSKMGSDERMSLKLNPMQKNHQLMNMRSHLEAVQNIIALLSSEKYDEASKVAYSQLGSTTEMKLMCASFGDKNFENLGLEFHKSADKMSEIFKSKDKNKSLEALSNTMNYCVQCHATYRQ